MITRKAIGLAAALLALSFGSVGAAASDRYALSGVAAAYATHRGERVHGRVLYRSPAYRAPHWRGSRSHHAERPIRIWHASPPWRSSHDTRRTPAVTFAYEVTYAPPVAASYLGGPLAGAMYNQPLCPCR